MASQFGPPPYDDLEDAQTAPPTRRDLFAPARDDRREDRGSHGPVVPAGSVTGRSLTLVISIMCFLACLTTGAVYMIYQSADAWLRDVASEVSVQVLPQEGADMEARLAEVGQFISRQPGVESAQALSLQTSVDLLEPWLGKTDALSSLPLPRLIAVRLRRDAPPDFESLSKELTAKFPSATLDDHRQWQQQIKTVTRSLALGGVAILLLVAAATVAIIVSATRSAMSSNREIVEVLHFVGATDGFIAREFEKHFLHLGVRAGLIGAGSAMLVFLTIPIITWLLGGGSMTQIELNRLIGTGTLDVAGYVLLGIVVIVISGICMITSRLGVYRILNSSTD
ncbi:MAG: ABC transporter permease [Alphaproteobacteria bacterium]|nr:ABC transporter permease [Alphaproteobacteria bacterium]